MKRLTIRLPEEQLEELEELVDNGTYPSKSEAARAGIRQLLDEAKTDDGDPTKERRSSNPSWSRGN